jgi:hypothetical protein
MESKIPYELTATQYRHAGDLPKVPGWNRKTNEQVAATLKQTLHYRKAGGVLIPSMSNIDGKPDNGVQIEQKVSVRGFDRFARSSLNIGSKLDTVKTEEILCVHAFYREAISESQVEDQRVRLLNIKLYLVDNTMEISEPRQANSGLPQGCFLKRTTVRNAETGKSYTANDLRIGQEILIHSKVFYMYGCDGFTREWYENNENPQPENMEGPQILNRVQYQAKQWAGKVMFPAKTFMEAALGKHMHDSKGMEKFLKYDQESLRFALQWDNTDQLFGDVLVFTMQYFIANDTVTIIQSRVKNSGREFFPRLLNRERLLKNPSEYLELYKREVGHHHGPGEIWKWDEFRVGMTLNVFGRKMTITAIDPKTRAFYKANGIEQPADSFLFGINTQRPELQPPPYTGYGDKEDSDLNWKRLIPKQPKKDYNRFIGKDGQVLRYTAKLKTDNPDDAMRRFVISYFLNDETLRVYEPPVRNSGIVGGRFLMKRKYLQDDQSDWIGPIHLQPGTNVILNKFEFEILGCDAFTKDFLAMISKK